MATLHIYALRQPGVFHDEEPVRFPTKKAEELLYLLLAHGGQMLDRDRIAEWLWPMRSPQRSLHSLATALWRLRQALPASDNHGADYLEIRPDAIGFNQAADYWFDAERFEQQAIIGLPGSWPLGAAAVRSLDTAAALYHADFLEGCCADWCLAKQEQLQLILVRVLKRLQCHNRLSGSFEVAIAQGRQLLALDPLLEEVHRELMRCYAAAGRRALALKQFHHCQEVLQRELQIGPMPKTTQLYRQIRAGQYPVPDSLEEKVEACGPVPLHALLERLHHVLEGLAPSLM